MDDSITWQQLQEQQLDEEQLLLNYHGYHVIVEPVPVFSSIDTLLREFIL
jgi:hypothetical protein